MHKANTPKRTTPSPTPRLQRPPSTSSAAKAAPSTEKGHDSAPTEEASNALRHDLERKDTLILQLEEALAQLRAENKILGGVINDLTSSRSHLEKENQKLLREIEKHKKKAWEKKNETPRDTQGTDPPQQGQGERQPKELESGTKIPTPSREQHMMTDTLRLDFAGLQKEISVLRAEVTKHAAEKDAMTSTILELNRELVLARNDQSSRRKSQKKDYSDRKDSNDEHQRLNAQHLAMVAETYKRELVQETERCANLTRRLQVMSTEKSNLLKTMTKYQQKSESLSARLSSLTKEMAELQIKTRRDLMHDVLDQMERGLTRDIDREVKKSVIISVLQMELQKETTLNETLRKSMAELHEQMSATSAELNELRRQHDGALRALEEDISRIQTLESGRRRELRLVERAESNCRRLESELRRMLDHHARCTLDHGRSGH